MTSLDFGPFKPWLFALHLDFEMFLWSGKHQQVFSVQSPVWWNNLLVDVSNISDQIEPVHRLSWFINWFLSCCFCSIFIYFHSKHFLCEIIQYTYKCHKCKNQCLWASSCRGSEAAQWEEKWSWWDSDQLVDYMFVLGVKYPCSPLKHRAQNSGVTFTVCSLFLTCAQQEAVLQCWM